MYDQQLVLANNKMTSKLYITVPLWRESSGDHTLCDGNSLNSCDLNMNHIYICINMESIMKLGNIYELEFKLWDKKHQSPESQLSQAK